MPYIKEQDRTILDKCTLANCVPTTAGELNYAITKLIKNYITRYELNYQLINDVLGALNGANQEFYRRVACPYEDKKIESNRDVY